MALNIRTRLTIWYVTLLTVSLLAFGAIFTYSLFRISLDRIDGEIGSVARLMPHTIMEPSGELLLPRNFDQVLERFFGVSTAGNFIQVRDEHGKLVARSSNLQDLTLPLTRDTFVASHSGLTTYEIIRSPGRSVRVVTKPVIIKGRGLSAIIQVGSSLEELEDVFRSLFYIFGLGIVASVVTASAIGWFLARKALSPVASITEKARRIGAESLNERVEVVGGDEIGSLAATINEMIERLERSFDQIKQFTADASHELKTPLTVLKGEMEIALRSKDDTEYMKEALASSLEEIDRMSSIVHNLLDLARIDVEKGVMKEEEVRLHEVLSERFEQFRRVALDRGVELDILRNEPAVVCGDPLRVGQLVYNLIDNAVKYTPEGGKVELTLAAEGGRAVLRVRDTGIGIDEEDLPYLFDRFYRVDKARSRDAGGAGLGLSICREIVNSMGGDISAESGEGSGTTFTVRLPLSGAVPPGRAPGRGGKRPLNPGPGSSD